MITFDARAFAEEWIETWNSHDLDRILSHYAADFEITTPMIRATLGVDSGTLRGKDRIRDYWSAGLKKVPDLHFELIDLLQGVDSVALYYRAVLGKMAVEVMFFDDAGKISRVIAHYS